MTDECKNTVMLNDDDDDDGAELKERIEYGIWEARDSMDEDGTVSDGAFESEYVHSRPL